MINKIKKSELDTTNFTSYLVDKWSYRYNQKVTLSTIGQAMDFLLFPYVKPELNVRNGSYLFSYQNIENVVIDLVVFEKSENIIKIDLEIDGNIIDTFYRADFTQSGNEGNITLTLTEENLPFTNILKSKSSITKTILPYTLKLDDGKEIISKTNNAYLIYPYIYGTVSSDITDYYSFSTKLIQNKGTKSVYFSPNNNRMFFGYPQEYYNLGSIKDGNNFDIKSEFEIISLNLPINVYGSIKMIPYYIYRYKSNVTLNNYKITFA